MKEYALIQRASYLQAYKDYGEGLPLVWVQAPHGDDNLRPNDTSFVNDFLTLMRAKVLFRANSTFSWWAGTLGCGTVYSPEVNGAVGFVNVPFVRGNHCRLIGTGDELRLKEGDHRLWNERGCWLFKDPETIRAEHQFNKELASMLVQFLQGKTVFDMGCGLGSYVAAMRAAGIDASGVDGNPYTAEIAETDHVAVQDLSVPFRLPEPVDWVVSFEVGEHIPRAFEDVFLDNLTANAREGLVLSWAVPTPYDDDGTMGHVNSRENAYIIERLARRGWVFDETRTLAWRALVGRTNCIHFCETLMLFVRRP